MPPPIVTQEVKPVGSADHPVGRHVAAKDLLHCLGDLADRAASSGADDGKSKLKQLALIFKPLPIRLNQM